MIEVYFVILMSGIFLGIGFNKLLLTLQKNKIEKQIIERRLEREKREIALLMSGASGAGATTSSAGAGGSGKLECLEYLGEIQNDQEKVVKKVTKREVRAKKVKRKKKQRHSRKIVGQKKK